MEQNLRKILISGNPKYGVAQAISEVFTEHQLEFASRATGWDFTSSKCQQEFAETALNYDVVIVNSALWKFNQTILLDVVYKKLKAEGRNTLIVCIGSTTDRVCKGTEWLYNAEKKALRDYCNSLGINGVWNGGPRVTLISFGTLSNNQHKHPDRRTMDIKMAAEYIRWIIEQPGNLHINELSVDPLQA